MKKILARQALALVAVAALAGAPANAQAPTTYLADLQLRENNQGYEIAAKNAGDIAKALRDHGVISAIESGYRSGYVWQLSWVLTPQKDSKGCHVKDLKVTLTSIATQPHWTPAAGAPAALQADWSVFSSALRAHLAKQRNLIVGKAQLLRPRVAKLQAQTCEALQRGVDFIGQQWIEDMHKADDDFARATRHGETGNVRWPPAKAGAMPAAAPTQAPKAAPKPATPAAAPSPTR